MSRSRHSSKSAAQNSGQKKEINMTDETQAESDAPFAPEDHTAPDVIAQLEDSSEEERNRIAAEELAGKARKSVLEAAGVDPGTRMDASGRTLNPWEVSPEPLEN